VTVRYVFVSLLLYGWAIIPFVYVQSFMCKVASSAYTWITVFNIFSGTYSLPIFSSQLYNTVYCCYVNVIVCVVTHVNTLVIRLLNYFMSSMVMLICLKLLRAKLTVLLKVCALLGLFFSFLCNFFFFICVHLYDFHVK